MLWGSVRIDTSRIYPPPLCQGPWFYKSLHFPLFSYKSVSCDFSLVNCSPCLLMLRCLIDVFLNFSRCLLMIFSVRPGQVFRKPCLVALRRIAVVGTKSSTCTVLVLVYLSVTECCLSQFLIVVFPGTFPTFHFAFS